MPAENRLATLLLSIRREDLQYHFTLSEVLGDSGKVIAESLGGDCEEALSWAKTLSELIDPSSITPAPRARQKSFDTISRTFFKNSIPKKIAESIQQTTCEFLVFEVDPEAAKIPWELCHDEIDFLCFRFSTGRRFSTAIATKSRTRPQSSEHGSILLISDPTGNLPASCVEGEDLSQFFLHDLGAETTWLTNNVDRLTFSRWLTQFDLLHFSGHFETSLENDEGIGWRLSDGLFTERDLGESIDSEDSLPLLIFNNACQSACFDSVSEKADGQSLLSTILSGGCLHYIGSLSKIDDHWGREFARVFYRHILDGLAVGAALRLARIHVRAADENDPTSWAQYVLYGDPLKGIYGERANFIEARSLVFLENVSEDSILKNVSTVERVPIGNGKNCLLFHLPSEAVRRSLSFLQNGGGMDSNGHESRIAISSGEVSVERCEQSGRALAISGPPVETGESLLGMTGPKQLLATRPVMDDARANVRSEDAPAGSNIVWLDHGFYRHVNIEEPLAVCEIGLEGFSPLSPPEDSEEATRIISPDQEPVLGWRPALDHVIPTAQEWVLKEKLGEGGFGEVWLAHHCETSSARVFKFCFKADRVRSLKREVTLFRILKDRLKKQDNIVQIYDVYFEASPFYISMEHVPGLDLGRWCQRYCGDERIDESVRLEIVAKIADSLQAAHDAGLIHRDVKPSNVLVEGTPDSPQNIRIKLTDFGIGQVQSTQLLMNVTALGFTETFSKTEMSSGSGSRLYMAPELLVGKQSSVRSDIYSLGVVLYQALLGNCDRPLTVDWEQEIEDPILLEDLRGCLAGEAGNRFRSAGEVAERLRRVPERREERAREDRRKAKEERRKRRFRAVSAIAVVALLVIGIMGVALFQINREREKLARRVYFDDIRLANEALIDFNPPLAKEILSRCPERFRSWEWGRAWFLADHDIRTLGGHNSPVLRLALNKEGSLLATADESGQVIVRNFSDGKILHRFRHDQTPPDALAFHPDSTYLAVSSGQRLYLWDLQSGDLVHEYETPEGYVGAVAFVEGGSEILATDGRGAILCHRFVDDSIRTIETGHSQAVSNFDISPDGKKVLTGSLDSWIKIIDIASGEILAATEIPGEQINDVEFSRDGESCYIAYRIFVEKRIGLELSLDYKEQITRSLIQDLELEPREVFIAGKTISKDVTLHALREGLPHPGWMGSLPGPRSLAFTPDGQFVLIPEPGGVSQKAVSEEEWRAFYMKRQMGYVKCLAFSPDNRLVVTGDTDLTLWDSRIGSLVSQTEASGQMTDLEFSPSGDKLFAVSNLGDVMVWDRPFRQEPRLIGSHADGRNRSAMGLDVCEPIGQFVSVGHDGTIQIREIESEELVRTIDAGGEPLNDVVFMKDGARILTVGKSKTVKEWDAVTGTLLRSFEGHTEDVHRICRIPHSLRFATSGGDAKTIVWDYESGEIIGSVDCFPQDPFPLVATPDGLRLMSYGKIWDLKTLSYIAEAPKAAMAISSDGLALAVGGGPYDTRIEPAFPHRFEGIGSSEDSKREVMEEYKRDFWKARYDLPFGAEGFLDLVEESEKKVTGLWNFGSYAKADVGATLEFTGMDLNLEGYSIFGANGEFGIPGIQGEDCLVMAFPIKRSNASYWLSPGADYRGDPFINEYTFVMDLYLEPIENQKHWVLHNTDIYADGEPELVISATGGIGFDGVYQGRFPPSSWRRIAWTVDLYQSPPTMKIYVDGEPVGARELPEGKNGRWSMEMRPGSFVHTTIFSDKKYWELGSGYANSIQVRNYAMTAEEIAGLGGPTASGIPLPDAVPPQSE